jgi:hypothetical protein
MHGPARPMQPVTSITPTIIKLTNLPMSSLVDKVIGVPILPSTSMSVEHYLKQNFNIEHGMCTPGVTM